MTPSEFLIELWGEEPPGKLLVFTLPNRKSHWYNTQRRSVHSLQDDIRTDSRLDVYTAMAALPQEHPERSNARYRKQHRIAAMSCTWADIDIQHELHTRTDRLPPDQESALRLLEELPRRPSIVNQSGHGLQAFWQFETPWIFGDQEEQEQAAAVAQWWHRRIKAACEERGWTIDSVFDITRVMRIPGYQNHKDAGNPVPVVNLIRGGPRLSVREIIAEAQAEAPMEIPPEPPKAGRSPRSTPRTGGRRGAKEEEPQDAADAQGHPEEEEAERPFEREEPPASGWPYTMNPAAQPPASKLHALLENSEKFRDTWNRKRRDLPYDESASSYDMSLARQAADAGWTNQEIIDLLIRFRQRHGLRLKLRDTYFRPTLQRIRASLQKASSSQKLSDFLAGTPPPNPRPGGAGDNGDAVRNELRTLWGFYIHELVRSKGDPPTFWMSTDHGDITIGGVGNITNQSSFINVVSACTLRYIQPVKKSEWGERVQNLFSITRTEDLGPLSNPVEETIEWTDRYLEEKFIEENDRAGAMTQRQPFNYQDCTHIFLEDLREWLRTRCHVDMPAHELGRRLKRAGFTQARPHVPKSPEEAETAESRRTTRHTWRVPG